MNSEERFKKSLEDLLSSKEFSFDEANWDRAQQMIDASKKPRRVLLYAFSALLLLGTISTGFYLFSDSFLTGTKTTVAETKTNSSTFPIAEERSGPSVLVNSEGDRSGKPAEVAAIQETLDTPQEISARAEPVKAASPATAQDAKGKSPASESKPEAMTDNGTKPLNAGKETVKAQVPFNESRHTHSKPTATKEKKGTIAQRSDKAAGNLAPDAGIPASSDDADKAPANAKAFNNTRFNNETENESFTEDAASGSIASVPDKDNSSNETKKEPLTNDPEEPEFKDTLIAKVVKRDTSKSKPVKVDDILKDNDKGQIGKPKEYPVLFSVEAGAVYFFGWNNGGTVDANGFNPVVGVNYFNNFLPKMSLTFGLHYTSVSNLNFSNYTSKVTRLGFGEESKVTVFTPVKVHYLFVPLRINYNLTPLNTIGIGCNLAYLLNVESDVESYAEKSGAKYDETLSKTRGYTEGFRQYDTQLSVFYKRRLYPNLSANLEVFYGLTDIKDNTFFKSNVFERNNGIKLTLVYNFIKR